MSKTDKSIVGDLQESLNILMRMKEKNAINEILFCRALLRIASDFVEADYFDKALSVLLKIPEWYFKDHFEEDMDQNDKFHELCHVMSRKLLLSGFTLNKLKPNVPTGSA